MILGATGKTGREIVDIALSRGHAVTAFVRSPHKITRIDAALSVTRGDPLDAAQLTAALRGHDAVLSALGAAPRDAFRPSTFMTESAASTVAAMLRGEVNRLAIVSAAVLFPARGPFILFFKWLLRHHARDLRAMEAVVQATDLDWTIARPPRLVRRNAAGYRARVGGLPPWAFSMSFRAVAAFMVDSVERGAYSTKVVGLGRS